MCGLLIAGCTGSAGIAGLSAEFRAADPLDTRRLAAKKLAAQQEPSKEFPAKLFRRLSSKAVSCISCG